MSQIKKQFKIDGTLTDMTSVMLSDPTGTYGVRRTDTDAVVVDDGTAMTKDATGVYTHTFTDPADDLTYRYYIEFVYDGTTYHITDTFAGPTSGLLTLATVRAFCRVGGTGEDTVLQVIADSVEAQVSRYTGRLFSENSAHTQKVSGGGHYLWPTVGPINSITSIEIAESDSTVSSALYRLVGDDRIMREADERWSESSDDYTLTANVGYDGSTDVPNDLVGVMYALCARAYKSLGTVERESAAGHSFSIRELASTDEMQILNDYKMGPKA